MSTLTRSRSRSPSPSPSPRAETPLRIPSRPAIVDENKYETAEPAAPASPLSPSSLRSADYRDWTPSRLCEALLGRGMSVEDARLLRAQEVDGRSFLLIDDQTLERWGVATWGRRMRVLQQLQSLATECDKRASALVNAGAFISVEAHRERNEMAPLSLHNGGSVNRYGMGPHAAPTFRQQREMEALRRREQERERMMRQGHHHRHHDHHRREFSHGYVPSPMTQSYDFTGDLRYRALSPRAINEYREHPLSHSRSSSYFERYTGPGPHPGVDDFEPHHGDQPIPSFSTLSLSNRGREFDAQREWDRVSRRERMMELNLEQERDRDRSAFRRSPTSPSSSAAAFHRSTTSLAYGGGYAQTPPHLGPHHYRSASARSARPYDIEHDGHGGGVSFTSGPYTTTFESAQRERERMWLERERERERKQEGNDRDVGYDSDEDRFFYHPRKHGYARYYKQQFDGFADPVHPLVGGVGPTVSTGWLDEFYRPVDIRASRKQWRRASLQPPSYTLRNNSSLPEARLKLEWVYGYASRNLRHNLFYNNVGDIIYPTASVVVVYKHRHRMQRHFQCHNDEIRAMAQHPINLNIMASGQLAGWSNNTTAAVAAAAAATAPSTSSSSFNNEGIPSIFVWDSTDFHKCWQLPLEARDHSIRCLSFSGDGRYLASVSNDKYHTIKIFEWETRQLVGSTRADPYPIYDIRFNHKDEAEFVTVGKHHAVFWRFDGVTLTARKAHIPHSSSSSSSSSRGYQSATSFYCVTFSEKGYTCIGADNGSIFVFAEGKFVREFRHIHRGKVLCLEWFPGGLVCGGGDGHVHVLDKKLEKVRTFTFHHRITSLAIRGGNLLVGTQGSQIFEIQEFMTTQVEGDTQAGAVQPYGLLMGSAQTMEVQAPDGRIGIEPIVQGHYDGELHAIATSPNGREIVSAGEDNQLIVWDMTTHRMVRRVHLSDDPGPASFHRHRHHQTSASSSTPSSQSQQHALGGLTSSHPLHQCARSVAISPNGKLVCVGLNSGAVSIFTAHDLRRIMTIDVSIYSKRGSSNLRGDSHHRRGIRGPHFISCMKFSPNGKELAVGSHGCIIALLDVRDDFRVKGVLSSHESFVTALDWSEDGSFLASTDGSYRLQFHQIFERDLAASSLVVDERLVRDVRWTNQNCLLGFSVRGILDTGESEGYTINCIEVSPSRAFVATGDDAGQVQLFRFPVLESSHESHCVQSHASHVVNVRWSKDDQYVISAGGHDNTICQWAIR